MKIMHISDLHLGKSLNGFDLILDQKHILNEIIKEIKINEIKYLLIAGDIFDKYIPGVDAVELLSSFLYELSNIEYLKTIIISGNHDQAERLNYLSTFLSKNNIYMITNIEDAFKVIVFDEDNIAFCGIPYLNNGRIRSYFGEECDEVIAHKNIIDNFFLNVDKTYFKVCIAHNFILGGQSSDSERILSLGALEQLPASLFDEFDYVALGHLHKRQKINNKVYYSGSPIKYSEKEYQNKNGYILIDTVDFIVEYKELTPLKEMIYIKDYYNNLSNYSNNVSDYVYVELLDEEKIVDVVHKIKKMFPYCLGVSKNTLDEITNNESVRKENLTDLDIFKSFYKMINSKDATEEQISVFTSILEEVEVND